MKREDLVKELRSLADEIEAMGDPVVLINDWGSEVQQLLSQILDLVIFEKLDNITTQVDNMKDVLDSVAVHVGLYRN